MAEKPTTPDRNNAHELEWNPPPVTLAAGGRARLEWEDALEAAAARLIETAIEHDNLAHMEESVMANELAAQLCAYGLVMDEVAHQLEHEADGPNYRPTPRLALMP